MLESLFPERRTGRKPRQKGDFELSLKSAGFAEDTRNSSSRLAGLFAMSCGITRQGVNSPMTICQHQLFITAVYKPPSDDISG